MPKFREITGQFVGYIPDSIDSDIVPDRAPMNGRVTFTPVFTGGVIAFPELSPPEFAHPRTIHAKIVDGFVQVEVNEGEGDDEHIVLQPLSLMVTVDDEASQVWSWRAEFDEILIGASDEYVKIPAWSFRVPDGTGPVDLTELVPLKSGGSVDVTKGPRGAGLQTITAVDGQLVFAYSDGKESTIPVPEAVQGPQGEPGPAGADGEQGPEGPQGPAGEIPDLLVGNITDATPVGKNLMLAATEGAARNALGLQTGATAIAGAYSELRPGSTQTNSRVWSAKNISDYVESQVDAAKVFVNVKDYGAVGDGVNEDHIPIQSAVNAASLGGGGTVVIPPGDYYFRQLVDLASNVNILGYGATIRKKHSTDSPYAAFRARSGPEAGYVSNVKNVTVEGLTFRGNYSENRSVCAFSLHRAQNITVRNCNFIEAAGSGHVFDLCGCETVTIQNCTFAGHYLGPTGSNVTDECIQLDQSKRGSVSSAAGDDTYDGTMSHGITVDNCKFLPLVIGDDVHPAPNPIGNHTSREGSWYEDIQFTNNTIVDPIQDTTSSSSAQSYRGNVHLVGNVRRVTISGNSWTTTTGTSVRVIGIYAISRANPSSSDPDLQEATQDGYPTFPSDIAVTGNTFRGFKSADYSNHTVFVQYIGNSAHKNGRISGLTFIGNNFSGRDGALSELRLRDTSRSRVIGNSFVSASPAPSPAIEIAFTGTMAVSGNIAEGYAGLLVELGTPLSEGLAVSGNIPAD